MDSIIWVTILIVAGQSRMGLERLEVNQLRSQLGLCRLPLICLRHGRGRERSNIHESFSPLPLKNRSHAHWLNEDNGAPGENPRIIVLVFNAPESRLNGTWVVGTQTKSSTPSYD